MKEIIRSSLREQIISFKRDSYFEKGCNQRETLLNPVVSLWCAYLFQRYSYNIGLRFLFNNISCLPGQKSTLVLLYDKDVLFISAI